MSDSANELVRAVSFRDYETAKNLIADGADVNERTCDGWTMLETAADQNNLEMCCLLLDNGADVNTIDRYGNTPLHKAAEKASVEICKLLLDAGADPNKLNNSNTTPLFIAAITNQHHTEDEILDILKAMVASGGDINMKMPNGRNMLLALCDSYVTTDFFRAVLALGAKVDIYDNDNGSALLYAAEHGNVEQCKLLLKCGADPNVQNNSEKETPMIAAAKYFRHHLIIMPHKDDDMKLYRLLLEYGANPKIKDKHGWTAESWLPLNRKAEFQDLLRDFYRSKTVGAAAKTSDERRSEKIDYEWEY